MMNIEGQRNIEKEGEVMRRKIMERLKNGRMLKIDCHYCCMEQGR